ncbi:hypothetical protein TNCV_2212561 [Trichonephila clavipes]|nr:hypothetical protein TNCV_2212561 [Trichonephila clavipes]
MDVPRLYCCEDNVLLQAVILAPDEGGVETSWKSAGGTDASTAIGNAVAQMLVKLLELRDCWKQWDMTRPFKKGLVGCMRPKASTAASYSKSKNFINEVLDDAASTKNLTEEKCQE